MDEPDLVISIDGNPSVEYILWLRRKLREANQNAMKASDVWNEESRKADKYCTVRGWTDYFQRRDFRKNNPYMSDAMDKWSWWEREAKRIAANIEAELAIMNWLDRQERKGLVFQEPIITYGLPPKPPHFVGSN